LWNFAQLNPSLVHCPEYSTLRSWIEDAAERGELIRDHYLYYSPAHRAEAELLFPDVVPDLVIVHDDAM
jgi:hypothetical protein